jgi:peptidoglycan/xylan/chitin deacetylase (PgdA/CDA1 family)
LRWSGLVRLWRFLHRHEVVILMAHGVMDLHEHASWVPLRPQLSSSRLERAIRTLSRHYRFVSLQDAVDMVTGRTRVRPHSLVLTFDDGYRNNLTHALPILRRWRVPATIFVATGHVDARTPFWFDRLDYALQQAPISEREVRVGPGEVRLSGVDRASLRASYATLRETAKRVHANDADMLRELDGLAAELEAESGRRLADIFERDPWSAVLTWDELRSADAAEVSIGSHTVDHVRLERVDPRIAADQLIRSRQAIETHTGRPCRHLAYPNGGFNADTVSTARACGYTAAVTTVEGSNRVGDDPLTLRRRPLPDTDDPTEILASVSGLSDLLSRLTRRPRWLRRSATSRGGSPR